MTSLDRLVTDPLAASDASLCPGNVPLDGDPAVGRVNTPPAVARWMAREAVTAARATGDVKTLTIVEPAAGSGVIVAALVEELARRGRCFDGDGRAALGRIWAMDSDSRVRGAAARRLHAVLGESPADWLRRRYRVGDSLLDSGLLPRRPIDLIVGNPPYMGVRHARRLPSFDRWRACYGGAEDLYAYFMRWAMRTVRPGGHVVLLVPDSWLSLASYEDLRGAVLQGRLRQVVRLPAGTFDRQVFPCFFVWQKAPPRGARLIHVDARSACEPLSPDARGVRRFVVPQSLFAGSPRRAIFVPTGRACRTAALWRAIERAKDPATALSDITRIADVGIHSRNCRHRLFHARRVKPGLQRLLQGRQIEPYLVRWDSPKARYRWVDIHYKARPHLRGRRANGQPAARGEYWDWQGPPAIHRLPERILIRQTGDRIVAARCIQDRVTHYTDNTLFTATLTDPAREAGIGTAYLLAYLNSAAVTRLYRFLSGEEGRCQAQIKIGLLRRLPFVLPRPSAVPRIAALAEQIERAAARGKAAREQQAAIDRHFARLFARCANGMLARSSNDTPDG